MKKIFTLMVFILACLQGFGQQIWYVTPNGNGALNGSSWADAAPGTKIQDLINGSNVPTSIWVKAGTYYPTYQFISGNSNSCSFLLKNGVKLYGGFAGSETSLSDRDTSLIRTTNKTTLSGQSICYHVILGLDLDSTARLDGFSITSGNANSAISMSVNSKAIDNCAGAGIFLSNSNIVLNKLTVQGNLCSSIYNSTSHSSTASRGAGIYNENGSPFINEVSISENVCTGIGTFGTGTLSYLGSGYGGGFFNINGSPVISNSSFTNNYVNANNTATQAPASLGGAFFCNSGNPTFDNCLFSGNYCVAPGGLYYGGNAMGGAIYANSSITLTNCNFNSNYCKGGSGTSSTTNNPSATSGAANGGDAMGGAIYALGTGNSITSTNFNYNYCQAGDAQGGGRAFGGAILTPTIYLSNCNFLNNYSQGGLEINSFSKDSYHSNAGYAYGGAIYGGTPNYGQDITVNITLNKSTFTQNNVSGGLGVYLGGDAIGGALYATTNIIALNLKLNNNYTIGGNSGYVNNQYTNGGNAFGGGIYAYSGQFTNCIISNNSTNAGFNSVSGTPWSSASSYAGALFAGTATLTNNTICNNSSSSQYSNANGNGIGTGGVYISNANIRNSIFWGNTPTASNSIVSNNAKVNYCIVQNGMSTNDGANHILNVDPLFINSNNDFHLQNNSPCIDAGDNSYFSIDSIPNLSSIAVDYDGNTRIIGHNIDLGSYEYQGEVTTPITLASFSGKGIAGKNILAWTTASETGSNGFAIERSADGKAYAAIGFTAAKNAGNISQDYTFTDEKPLPGDNYYRLKITDLDGKTTYSDNVVHLALKAAATLKLYPNPAHGFINIETGEKGTLTVTDAAGKTVLSAIATGSGTLRLNVSKLPAGIYFYTLNGQKGSFVKQ